MSKAMSWAAVAAVLAAGLVRADDPPKPRVHEYRELRPTIDTVEPVRLLSADKAADLEKQVRAGYARLAPAVVRLRGTDKDGRAFDENGYPRGGAVSGVIVSKDGLVLTCAHHGQPPRTPVVFELADGRRVKGVFLGRFESADPSRHDQPDLGLARIEEKGEWPLAVVGPADPPPAGTVCLAIGYPGSLPPGAPPQLRLCRALTTPPGYPFLRATTAFAAGDSGGPLFDLEGRVLGVVHGGEDFAHTKYEPVAAYFRHRDRLVAGEVVSAPRDSVRARQARLPDPAAFNPALDLEDAVLQTAGKVVVRVYDGTEEVATGLVVDPDGWVLTKRTLVDGRSNLRCRISYTVVTRMVFPARVVASSAEHDLALLKLEGAGRLPAPRWADGRPAVGQLVAPLLAGRAEAPLQVAVVGSAVRREDPPLGDVAQLPLGVEAGPDGEPVVRDPEAMLTGETEVLPNPFREGDVVTHLDDTPTPTFEAYARELTRLLYAPRPDGKGPDTNRAVPGNLAGEPLAVTVRRDGKAVRVRAMRVHSGALSPVSWWVAQGPCSLRRDGFPAVFAHDGRVRPDQCGGPVVDLDGRVVGVTIARADSTRTLAIPADVVQKVVAELRKEADRKDAGK